ncbi:MAG: ComEC/Rec2 family competence protein [Clostridia bacterium]|nr:ComEC/Rec2 family competence protein [Clostridia bacterium]
MKALIGACLGFCLGVLLGWLTAAPWQLPAALAAVALAGILLTALLKKKTALFLCIGFATCCAGALWFEGALAYKNAPYAALTEGMQTFSGEALSSAEGDLYSRGVRCRVTSVNGHPVSPVTLWLSGDCVRQIRHGQQVRGVGMLYVTEDRAGALQGLVDCSAVQVEGKETFSLLDALRVNIRRVLRTSVGEEPLPQVLLLGGSGGMEPEFLSASSAVGASHFFAVSGMHLSYLAAVIFQLLRLFRARRSTCLKAVAVVLFACLCGLTPSIVRAAVMWLIMLLAEGLRREHKASLSLLWALTLICLADPLSIVSAGLQLSFAAMAGILWFLPSLQFEQDLFEGPKTRWWNAPFNLLAMTVAAQLLTQPLSVWLFGSYSWMAPLTCLILTVPVACLFWCTALTVIIGFVWPWAASLTGKLCLLISRLFAEAWGFWLPWEEILKWPTGWRSSFWQSIC